MGLEAGGGLCLKLGSPLRSEPPSPKNLLQNREESVDRGEVHPITPLAPLSLTLCC